MGDQAPAEIRKARLVSVDGLRRAIWWIYGDGRMAEGGQPLYRFTEGGSSPLDVLVTGGAGFIGSNLVRCLAASGDRVRILDDLSTGSTENLRDADRMAEVVVA